MFCDASKGMSTHIQDTLISLSITMEPKFLKLNPVHLSELSIGRSTVLANRNKYFALILCF